MIKVFFRHFVFTLLEAAAVCGVLCMAPQGVRAQSATAQDATTAWNAVTQTSFDSEKTASVEGVTIVHDRIRITLKEGSISFSGRADGVVFGAAFKGRGTIEIAPPNALEAQQLELFTKQKTLNMDFTEATFSFTDDTFEQVAKQVKWTNGATADLENLYNNRQRAREDLDAEIVPRLFEGVLDGDRSQTAYFAADMKTNSEGWVLARYDALQPEEISVGRYVSRGSYALLFDTWMSFPAGNVNASQAYEQPTSKDIFAVHGYQIDASVTSGADLSATTKVNLEYQKAGERVLVFELSPNLRVTTVKDESGAALAFFQPRDPKDHVPTYGDYVVVVLPAATQQAKTATLTFEYSGKHLIQKVGSGNYFCPSYGWYPGVSDDFATRSDFDMTFHTPKKLTLVATGDKVSENTSGDSIVTHWKSPAPQAVSGFAYGDYKLYDEKVGNIDVQIYANRSPDDFLSSVQMFLNPTLPGQNSERGPAVGTLDPAATVKTMGIEIGNNLRVFQNYFGPLPFQRLAVTNIPYSYGQGWPMLLYLSVLSFLDETQRHVLGVADQIGISDFFRAHEVSHQWWGHEIGWKSYHDQWLSEGFAQFSGNLYVQFRDGGKQYRDRLNRDREDLFSRNNFGHRYEELGPVWMGERLASSQAPAGYNTVIYEKGGYVLEMLRAMLYDPRSQSPDDLFKALMQDFTKSFTGKAASTEDFKGVVERHMAPYMDIDQNHRMDWFFNEYVYGTGIAQYHLDYTVKPSPDNKWEIDGTVTQSGVPTGWKDTLPVYVHVKGKSGVIGWMKIDKPTTSLRIALPFQPDKVSLNDNGEILAEIK
ncbi:MAG TPA: M1 family aminopeptidase [Candidatus Acidoferrales bacterium]|nr:M1 family aminopeptidase [Candidatus Acidoferrales bacterium]